MKKQVERWIALLICLCIWSSVMVPLYAADTLSVSFSPKNPSVTKSTEEQTVTMELQLEESRNIEIFIYSIICDAPIEIKSVTVGSQAANVGTPTTIQNRKNYQVAFRNPVTTDNLGAVTFVVPAGTSVGEYEITLDSGVDGGVIIGNNQLSLSAQAVIEVTESGGGSQTGSYTASLSGVSTATVGDSVELSVAVSGNAFASAEYTLDYDATRLSLEGVSAGEYSIKNGKVTVVDYGASKVVPYVYEVTFRALQDGTANVTLTDAAFGTSDNAETGDLTAAAISAQSVAITIAKREFEVVLPIIFEGNEMAVEGETYQFKAKDMANYNYGTVTVTMGENTFTVAPDAKGIYLVEKVSGELVIAGTRTPKTYDVTFQTDTGVKLPENGKITYDDDYSFTLPTEENYAISITSVKCNGASVDYGVDGKEVTIKGTDILGDIVITLDKVRTNAAVNITGNAASDLVADAAVAQPGKDFSVTLNADSKYEYQVTAMVNGVPVTLMQNGNVFTIPGEEVEVGAIEFSVTKTLKRDGFGVSQYLQFNGTMVWLVKNEVAKASGSVYTYDGEPMFWSDKYNAYCYLVIAQTSEDIGFDKLGLQTGNAASVDYGMDVNNSGKVDMNDAQLTYNLYNNKYQGFSSTVTMEKILRADVNGSGNVNVDDASAIVNQILGR